MPRVPGGGSSGSIGARAALRTTSHSASSSYGDTPRSCTLATQKSPAPSFRNGDDAADEFGAREENRALHVVRRRATYDERARLGPSGLRGRRDGKEVLVERQLVAEAHGDLPEEFLVLALRHD